MKWISLFGLLAVANAHDWMTAPASRNGNAASTTGPCPAGTDPNEANLKVELGQAFTTSWNDNHGGNHYIKVASLSQENDLESLEDADLVFYGVYTGADPQQVTIEGVLEGYYVLQYAWSNYRNCATIQVVGEDESTSGVGFDPITADATINCVTYCEDFDKYCNAYTNWTYTSHDDCLDKCSTFPLGEVGDITGNSLYCREHHLHVEGGLPSEHCPHASYDGELKCIGGDFLPAMTLDIVSEGTTSAAIQTELEEAFAAYEATVSVTEAAVIGTYIVSVQFKADGGQEIVDDYLANDGAAVEALLATTTLEVAELVVLGAVETEVGLSASESVSSNTLVAAIMLPLALIIVVGGLFTFKNPLLEKFVQHSPQIHQEKVLTISAGLQLSSLILWWALMATNSWAKSGVEGVTFGLYQYCNNGACASMASYDPNAASVIQAVQFFVTTAMLANLFGGTLTVLMLPKVGKLTVTLRNATTIAASTAYTSISVFLGLCLYAAYYYDVISQNYPDSSIGWALDFMGIYWVMSLLSFAVGFRLFLDTTKSNSKHPNSAKNTPKFDDVATVQIKNPEPMAPKPPSAPQPPAEPEPAANDWEEHTDPESGDKYYFNTVTEETVWDKPY